MPEIRCIECGGSGQIMGGGTMLKDCEYCDGTGKPTDKSQKYQDCDICGGTGKIKEIDYLKKDSDSYKKAKDKLMDSDDKINSNEAEKILDEEILKQKGKRKK
jgi:RecJ-like exonuclease